MDLLSARAVPEHARETKRQARAFADEHVLPNAAELDASAEYPTEIIDAAKERNLAGQYVPEEYGGEGWTLADRLAAVEEFFRGDGGIGLALQLVDFGAKVVTMYGTEEQKSDARANRHASNSTASVSPPTTGWVRRGRGSTTSRGSSTTAGSPSPATGSGSPRPRSKRRGRTSTTANCTTSLSRTTRPSNTDS